MNRIPKIPRFHDRGVVRVHAIALTLLLAACSGGGGGGGGGNIDLSNVEATRTRADRALAAGDFAYARSAYEALLRDMPEDPTLQRALARSLVGLGLRRQATSVYRDVIDEGFGAVLIDDPGFTKLAGEPTYDDLRARVLAQSQPNARARVAFEIPEQKFVPEGMAFDPRTGRFFVSSTYLRKVVVREPDGRLRDFVPSGDQGLLQALGMKVDAARSRLIVVTATDDARLVNFNREDLGRSGVLTYDASSGRLLAQVWLAAGGHHLFNDLVVARDGQAYITDSDAGRIYRLSADGKQLTAITPPGVLLYPNGIDIESSQQRLYVADARGVFTLDLPTGVLKLMPHPKSAPAVEIDGLYLHGNDLIGVQTVTGLNRVMAFHLSPDHLRIESAEPLDSADPRLAAPTEGVLVGNELYFIANSFQEAVDENGNIAAPERTAPNVILTLHLPTAAAP